MILAQLNAIRMIIVIAHNRLLVGRYSAPLLSELQPTKSPTNTNEKIATMYLFFQSINTFHLEHLRASEVKARLRNDIIAKRLT